MLHRLTAAFWRRNPRPDERALAEARARDASLAAEQRSERLAFDFIEKLARALHRYGYTAPHLEDALTAVCRRLGIRGEFYATPTAIFATLESGDTENTFLVRVEPGGVNLDKLTRLDRLVHDVANGRVSPVDASRLIDEIRATPPRYRGKASIAGAVLASACSARFFGGGWREVATCAVIGLITGVLALIARRDRRYSVYEPVAAFFAGFIACAAAAWMPPVSLFIATCGGLIILLPGLTVTTAINELATQHLASGTARMMSALILFATIGFGLAVGLKLGLIVFSPSVHATAVPLPTWTVLIALLAAPLGYMVRLQADPRDAVPIVAICALAFAASRFGSQTLGVATGAFSGAMAVGIASGLHSRWKDRPSIVTATFGILMLVPGSVGFRSITDIISKDPIAGLQTGITMIATAVAIVTGLLLARVIVPRRSWSR
ncbi:MAG TPA: threonine/serine exporter family protein [Candidatus Krumholzibacteria bacterium]